MPCHLTCGKTKESTSVSSLCKSKENVSTKGRDEFSSVQGSGIKENWSGFASSN